MRACFLYECFSSNILIHSSYLTYLTHHLKTLIKLYNVLITSLLSWPAWSPYLASTSYEYTIIDIHLSWLGHNSFPTHRWLHTCHRRQSRRHSEWPYRYLWRLRNFCSLEPSCRFQTLLSIWQPPHPQSLDWNMISHTFPMLTNASTCTLVYIYIAFAPVLAIRTLLRVAGSIALVSLVVILPCKYWPPCMTPNHAQKCQPDDMILAPPINPSLRSTPPYMMYSEAVLSGLGCPGPTLFQSPYSWLLTRICNTSGFTTTTPLRFIDFIMSFDGEALSDFPSPASKNSKLYQYCRVLNLIGWLHQLTLIGDDQLEYVG